MFQSNVILENKDFKLKKLTYGCLADLRQNLTFKLAKKHFSWAWNLNAIQKRKRQSSKIVF